MLRIGIIGDYDASNPTHPATTAALEEAAQALGEALQARWFGTAQLGADATILAGCDAIVASPGSPYADFLGALAAIQYARLQQIPFLGT